MTPANASVPKPQSRRSRSAPSNWLAFVVGLPVAAAVLWTFLAGPGKDLPMARYVHHKVEWVEVVMFCCAAAALGVKLVRTLGERRAFQHDLIPAWDGKAVPVAEAATLLGKLNHAPNRMQQSSLGRRIGDVLHFLCSRGSADDLDDQLRALADTDALTLEGSYALTRFITWAIPILGFLGTVLGITQAISGVTPEVLEKSLSTVTDGLALAFDATALGLGLTMVTMFLSFVVERSEQGILEEVDRYADRHLAHRFERLDSQGGEFIGVVRQHTNVLVQAVEQVVRRQADVWAQAFAEAEKLRLESAGKQQQEMAAALHAALEQTHQTHARRLAEMERQSAQQVNAVADKLGSLAAAILKTGQDHQAALGKLAQAVGGQAQTLAKLQDDEKQIIQLQTLLQQNLATLAGAGAFEQALHSLTAAVHLLTARHQSAPSAGRLAPDPRSGAAA